MGAGKNKSHRKKRISKHVLQAEERRKQTEAENKLLSSAETGSSSALLNSPVSTTTPVDDEIASSSKSGNRKEKQPKKKKTVVESKTKDPEEAASYLTLWNYYRNNDNNGSKMGNHGNTTWKFNKNTQSWLLRHMYDSDKVSKATFGILVDYIIQGGEGTCRRVEEDAKVRARRYKEWEKRHKESNNNVEQEGLTTGDSTQGDDNRDANGNKKAVEEMMDDDSDWNQLSDHDKRKVYKRARKVLDALKAKRDVITKTENEG
mmetsp:Transcript_29441/g.59210  ORF Transcript_29441/g.59210 Transcript_29441/m.59210 type:complete len:261 (-) Transcript_29441:45-827(-)